MALRGHPRFRARPFQFERILGGHRGRPFFIAARFINSKRGAWPQRATPTFHLFMQEISVLKDPKSFAQVRLFRCNVLISR